MTQTDPTRLTSRGQARTNAAAGDTVVAVHDDVASIDAAAWDELVEAQPSATPFLSHAYLLALQQSASAVAHTGWAPHFLSVSQHGKLVAACPLYLKDHSYGEYVFDWAWADAYRRHGLDYYPKLLDAIPFTPVPGPRLLARNHEHRLLLLRAMEQLARDAKLSSAHLLFLDDADLAAARDAGWSLRSTVQFHWSNREPAPYLDFADFLASLQREKRKKIQQERRRVGEAGVSVHGMRPGRPSKRSTGTSSTAATRAPTASTTPRRTSRAISSPAWRRPWPTDGCSSPRGARASASPAR